MLITQENTRCWHVLFFQPFVCRSSVFPGFQREDRLRLGAGVRSSEGDARKPEPLNEEGVVKLGGCRYLRLFHKASRFSLDQLQ